MTGDSRASVSLPPTAAWVWHASPRPVPGLDAVFVRCASGASGSGQGNVDFARNWRRWKADGRARAIPWTWFGPPASSNGSACADVVHQIAPGEPVYIVDIEYDPPAEEVMRLARRLRKLEPGAMLGFTSYPTRAEAEARGGVPWDACVEAFDFGLPQVYNARQRGALLKMNSPVVADMEGKPIHVAVFPDADAEWTESAQLGLLRHLGASGWSLDQSSFDRWSRRLAELAAEAPAVAPGAPAAPAAPGDRGAFAREPHGVRGARGAGGRGTRGAGEAAARPAARSGEIAARVIAVIEQHVADGGSLGDAQLTAVVARVLREEIGADGP